MLIARYVLGRHSLSVGGGELWAAPLGLFFSNKSSRPHISYNGFVTFAGCFTNLYATGSSVAQSGTPLLRGQRYV